MTPSQSISPEHQRLLENASWLQRLATSLVRDPQLADDMVQQTMVAALEGAPDHAAKQRPWLARVLRNKVNANYRTTSRRQVREAKVAVEECGEIPHDVIERAEIGKLLTEAVLRLEEPFRTTLLMRFHEDKTPKEIARELGIPAATVRTRVNRGLEKLRREICAGWGKDWTTCSPALIAFAGASGVSAFKGGALLICATLALGISATLFVMQPWQTEGLASPTETGLLTSTPQGSSASNAQDSSRNAPENIVASLSWDIQRETLPATIMSSPSGPSSTVTIKGRCVSKEHGTPLAGCRIQIWGWLPSSGFAKRNDISAWQKPADVITEGDGRFEFVMDHCAAEGTYNIVVSRDGRIERRGEWNPQANVMASHDFGDLALERGTVLEGTVFSTEGLPIANASITTTSLGGQGLFNRGIKTSPGAQSDENGFFRLRSALPAGPRDLHVRASGFMQIDPMTVIIQQGYSSQTVSLKAKPMPFLEGRIILDDGTPIANARVTADPGPWVATPGPNWIASGRTNADGVFRIYATNENDAAFCLAVAGKGLQPIRTEYEFRWGQQNVELVVSHTHSLDLFVRNAGTEIPVEDYSVIATWQRPGPTISSEDRKAFAGPFQNGLAHLSEISAGQQQITIVPADPHLRPHHSTVATVPLSGNPLLEIELERMTALKVLVQTKSGAPVEGSKVTLTDTYMEGLSHRLVQPNASFSVTGNMPLAWVLSKATTDADGIAHLYFPKSLNEGGLLVQGNHLSLETVLSNPFAQDGPVKVVVVGLGGITGQFQYPESMFGKAGLFFQPIGTAVFQAGIAPDQLSLPGEDGVYQLDLDPGNYRVFFAMPRGIQDFWSGGEWAPIPPALGDIEIVEGETMQRDWDALQFTPGTLKGRIFLDGVAQANASFRLRSEGLWKTDVYTDEEGWFEFKDLPPADYQVYYRGPSGLEQWPWELLSEEIATVSSTGIAQQDFNFRFHTLRVRLLDPETSAPFPNTNVMLSGENLSRVTTDAEGWLTIAPAPKGEIRCTIIVGESQFVWATVQIKPNQQETTVDVQTHYRK